MEAIEWDGKLPIRKPGIYSGIPLSVYHSQKILPGPSVSSSGLRKVLEINSGSPKHFWHEWSANPNYAESEDKPYFILGRAAHNLLLGEDTFRKHFAIREEANSRWDTWRTNDAKDWRDQMAVKNIACVTLKEIETIRGISDSLKEHPFKDLLRYQVERSIFFQDEETGLWVKSRPDAIPIYDNDGADLKLANSVSDQAIINAISSYGYHQQAALVRWALQTVAKIDLASFSFVWAESRPPYCVRVSVLPPRHMDIGHIQNRDALRLIARCIKEGRWPGPDEGHATDLGLSKEYVARATELFRFGERVNEAA